MSGSAADRRATSTAAAVLVLATATCTFAWVAHRVATKRSERFDQQVRDWVQSRRAPHADVAVRPVTLLSLPILVVSGTALLALWLRHAGRNEAALAVAASPLVAAVAGQSFTTFLSQRNPPDRGDSPHGEVAEPSFPSGHTTGVTAEALTIAYVLASEELASLPVLALLPAWPIVVGLTRVYRDRHWMTDILGGWAAGAAVAALSVLLYKQMQKHCEEGRTA